MMDDRKDGGPAFPHSYEVHPDMWQSRGMTLRDWFAGNAPFTLDDANRMCGPSDTGRMVLETLADLRYAYADAMLAARSAK